MSTFGPATQVVHRSTSSLRWVANVYAGAIGLWFAALVWSYLLAYLDPMHLFAGIGVISIVVGIVAAAQSRSATTGFIVSGIGVAIGGLLALLEGFFEWLFNWIKTGGVEFGHSEWAIIILAFFALVGFALCGPATWRLLMKPPQYVGLLLLSFVQAAALVALGFAIVWGLSWVYINWMDWFSGWTAFGTVTTIAAVIGVGIGLLSKKFEVTAIVVLIGLVIGALFGVLSIPLRDMCEWITTDGVEFLFAWEGICFFFAASIKKMFGDDKDDDD